MGAGKTRCIFAAGAPRRLQKRSCLRAPGPEPGVLGPLPTAAGDPGPDAMVLRALCLQILEFRDWPTTQPSAQRGFPGLRQTWPLTTGPGQVLPRLQVHHQPLDAALNSRPRGCHAVEEKTQLTPSQGVWMHKVVSRKRRPQSAAGTRVLGGKLRHQAWWRHPN